MPSSELCKVTTLSGIARPQAFSGTVAQKISMNLSPPHPNLTQLMVKKLVPKGQCCQVLLPAWEKAWPTGALLHQLLCADSGESGRENRFALHMSLRWESCPWDTFPVVKETYLLNNYRSSSSTLSLFKKLNFHSLTNFIFLVFLIYFLLSHRPSKTVSYNHATN